MAKTNGRLGERMQAAAAAAGLTAIDISCQMHTSDVSVRRWWNGDREPRGKTLEQYAEIVGKPVEWFHRPDDAAVNQETKRILLRVVDLVMAGRDAASAVERETADELQLTAAEKRMLASQSDNIRFWVNGWTDQAWDHLTETQKAWIVTRIAEMAAGNQAPG